MPPRPSRPDALLLPFVLTLAGCGACEPAAPKLLAPWCPDSGDLAAFVNPMIGTKGPGNVIPGALLPHGLVKLSPDTNAGANSIDAYDYDNDRIEGFSHTHLEGPGGSANGFSQVLVMPTVGSPGVDVAQYQSRYDHGTEEASPGYYAVTLTDPGVRAELTTTAHAGIHRYTFPATSDAGLVFDLGHSRGKSIGGEVTLVGDRILEGFGAYQVHPLVQLFVDSTAPADNGGSIGEMKVYFHAELSKPATRRGTFVTNDDGPVLTDGTLHATGPKIGASLGFATTAGEVVEVRVGISMISVEQARLNLTTEVGTHTFDELRTSARAAWNCALGRVEVEGGTGSERTTFYTALYHSMIEPTDYTEVGGVFNTGASGFPTTVTSTEHHLYSDDWCAWDTYRTSRPLATILEPELVDDVVFSYVDEFQRSGWLNKCPWGATGNSRVMSGNPEVAIIADALVKGFRRFDTDAAWDALTTTAETDDPRTLVAAVCGYFNLGTPPEYISSGYVSHECDVTQSASMTLEYAYADWCTAQAATVLGHDEDAARYLARSQNYRNVWNPAENFMQGRTRAGDFVEPFDPADEFNKDFTEANSWIYTFFVPHDVPGLTALVGGNAAMVTKLDAFFDGGHFDPGNEPDFHTPFLYNAVHAAARTQARVAALRQSQFSDRVDGLPGNDDSGAMSAWFVFAALGLYPVAPGDPTYELTTPLFERVTLHLHPQLSEKGTFVIEAPGVTTENGFIQQASLNGEPLAKTTLTHAQLMAGGRLSFVVGAEPSTWGTPIR